MKNKIQRRGLPVDPPKTQLTVYWTQEGGEGGPEMECKESVCICAWEVGSLMLKGSTNQLCGCSIH